MGKLLDKIFRREDIGTPDTGTYLTRWTLAKLFDAKLYLHWFRKSDSSRCFHDHPCDVWSFVFRGTYLEYSRKHQYVFWIEDDLEAYDERLTIVKAPTFRRFRAEHAHHIELPDETADRTWSLCLFWPKRRQWGFFVKEPSFGIDRFKWLHWLDYMRDHGGTGGCD